jgi:UPF0716 family protein affecting phage T7 exclusion
MPLSEHEQRMLDEIERALYAEDPKFASAVRQNDLKAHRRRRLVRSLLVFVVGVGLLVAGVITSAPVLSVVGFVLMLLTGLALARGVARGAKREPTAPVTRFERPKASASDGGWRERFEERWKRRWDDRDR